MPRSNEPAVPFALRTERPDSIIGCEKSDVFEVLDAAHDRVLARDTGESAAIPVDKFVSRRSMFADVFDDRIERLDVVRCAAEHRND